MGRADDAKRKERPLPSPAHSPPEPLAPSVWQWPLFDVDVQAALSAAADSGSWGNYHGPHCDALSHSLAELHQVPHTYLCCSGTLAVELALRGLRIGPGDEVILAGYDFPGNFRSIEAVGARPVLVDIDPATWCLDPNHLAAGAAPDVRAVIVSHLHGGLADMRTLCQEASDRGWAVIEDACQAPGAQVQGRTAGSWGDVGVLSFGGSKLLTAGRGGALITRSAEVLQRIKIFSERGNQAFPLSELQAAVLRPQLGKLVDRNRRRHQAARQLANHLRDCDALRPIPVDASLGHASFYKFAWLWSELDGRHTSFLEDLQAAGVRIDTGFRGFTRRGGRRCRQATSLDHARRASENTLLLHHPVLLQPEEIIDKLAAIILDAASNRAP